MAHTIKSSARALAGNQAMEVALAIEKCTSAADLTSARRQVPALRQALDQLLEEIRQFVAE